MKKNKNTIHSLFGMGNTFKGEFILNGPLRVDGTVIGDITTDSRVHISRSGKGEGTVKAKTIDIGGEFKGKLVAADHVYIRSTAIVNADIETNLLELEEGAFFSGDCKIHRKSKNELSIDLNDIPPITDSSQNKIEKNLYNEKKLLPTN